VVQRPLSLIAWGLALAVAWAVGDDVRRADTFRITRLELAADASLRVPPSLIGANLLTVDLRALSGQLQQQQPWLKEVRVVRLLPNTLRIEPVLRQPIAQVRLGQWYLVDADGVLLPGAHAEPVDGVPRVAGLTAAADAARAGARPTDERLTVALRVAELLAQVPWLAARRPTEINVSQPDQLRFRLKDGTEVRCGSVAELPTHLGRLRAALKTLARHPLEVATIDVRFPDPVIRPRT
jgi:cell division septal protein FtsQ